MPKQSIPLEKRQIPRYIRMLIPFVLIVIWFVVAGIGGPSFGKISEVASNDQATFLPASAESTRASNDLKKFQGESSIPALIVFSNNGELLDTGTIATINQESRQLADIEGMAGELSPLIVSEDSHAGFIVANMQNGADYREFTAEINETLDASAIEVSHVVSGPVGFLNDLGEAFSGIDGILLAVALGVVFIILVIVYRSPLLPFVVLFTSLFALCAAILIVFWLAKAEILTLNGQVQGILFILVIGAATDYALLLVARYREELKHYKESYQAIIASWKRSIEPIVAAGGTVIAGLLCLLLSDLNSDKALGPVGAIGIVMAIVSALTLLPALLAMFGRKVFWPRIPQYAERAKGSIPTTGLWHSIGQFVAKRARPIWITVSVVLIVCSFGLLQLKADGVPQSEFVLGTSEARDGQRIIDTHFPGGSGTPTYIIIPTEHVERAVALLEQNQGVSSISAFSEVSPSGSVPLGEGSESLPFANLPYKEVEGEVLLEATLEYPADSNEAQETIVAIRSSLHELDATARVGGTAAVQLDTRVTAEHDRMIVIPTVLVVITIILMVLLRSILAPLLLLLTTVLSFAATLGISALVFNHLLGFPGADPSVVLYGFIFLVALGIDYNIFLITRIKEDSKKVGTRKGTITGLVATGGVITSAGIVLAATFGALAVIPILFLAQLAFIVAFGVLLDTIIIRSLLVPALSHDLGGKFWWPSKKLTKD